MKLALILLIPFWCISTLYALPALSSTPVEEVISEPHYHELSESLINLNEQFALAPTSIELNHLLKQINKILNQPNLQEKLAYATNPSDAFDLMNTIGECLKSLSAQETLLPKIYRFNPELILLKRQLYYLRRKYPKSSHFNELIYLLPKSILVSQN